MWREIGKYNVVNPDGNVEIYSLERNKKGTFRLRNDFGNISIEFDHINAGEFFRKVFNDVESELDWDLNGINDMFGFLDDDDDSDTVNDCDGDI